MKKLKAFTLIELMVVVAIIGILAALLIPAFKANKKRQAAQHQRVVQADINIGDTVSLNGINSTGVVNRVHFNGYSFDVIVRNENGTIQTLDDVNAALVKKIYQ